MKTIADLISSILLLFIPKKNRLVIKKRFTKVKEALTGTLELRIFWRVVFFPISLPVALFFAIIKCILILFTPGNFYGNLRYALRQFVTDVKDKHMSFALACKRFSLLMELFIKGRERKKTYGSENPDITFYVIRPYYFLVRNELATSLSDLFFHYYRNLQQLSYAINKGWIPVVDWENYTPMRHMEDYPINGTVNGWEYFWKQPSEYTLEEVYKSKNVILANRNSIDYGFIPTPFLTPPFEIYVKRLAQTCPEYDKFFIFNEATKNYVNEWEEKLFPPSARILGVSVRGSAYGVHPVHGHPKQPAINKVISLVRENLESQNMDYVFFACEAQFFVDIMKEEFGDKLIVLPRKRITEEPKEGEINPLYYPGQKYQTNLDYLTEMALLSKCTSMIGGMTSGTRVAIIWNNDRFENVHIFDNGLW